MRKTLKNTFRVLNTINQFVWDFIFYIRKDSSQYGEQSLLMEHIRDVPSKVYLEIGAHQPIKCSNSWHLYRRGWNGLCIDPQRQFAPNWKILRPKDEFLAVAVAADDSESVVFFEFERKVNLVSTMDPEFASTWIDRGFTHNQIKVPAISPYLVVERFIRLFGCEPTILFIDVEGLDYLLLQKFLKILKTTQWVLFEDHKNIPISQLAPGFIELGRAGPSVLISRLDNNLIY